MQYHNNSGAAVLALAAPQVAVSPGVSAVEPAMVAKRAVDILVSATVLIALLPLLAVIFVLVRLSGGPALFRQRRVGQNGEVFDCLKFRSMVPDAERVLQKLMKEDEALRTEWQQSQKLRHDPRITRVGEFIRRTSIDELPQLWNVLRGDMSLIGPRPVMVNQLSMYGNQVSSYIAMRPGITGLWQVTARGDADFARRIELDCRYVREFSPFTDLMILIKTFKVVLTGSGAY